MTDRSKAAYDVTALGAAIVDILAKVDDAFLADQGVEKGAMTLVDSARAEAIYAAMGPAREISGGSAANTIAGLAALGAQVCFAGKIKDDQLGRIFSHDIRAVGAHFDTAPFAAHAEGATARSMILVTPDAQRSMCTDLGVSGQLRAEDLPLKEIERSKVLYLEGYLWDSPETKAAFTAAMTAAKKAGAQVALTLSDTFCVERHRESFLEIVRGPVDILFANEAEILALYETGDFDAAATHAGRDVTLAALTRSEKGCAVISQGEQAPGVRVDVPAEPIQRLVDTTGAGDLFAAGFLFGHTHGASPEACGRMGCVAAAEVIQHIGARPEEDLKNLFRANDLA